MKGSDDTPNFLVVQGQDQANLVDLSEYVFLDVNTSEDKFYFKIRQKKRG